MIIGFAHAELARAFSVIISAKWNSVPPKASAITTATSLAERITMARMAVSTVMVSPRRSDSLVGFCWAAC